jgi:hypothetical protein
MVGEIKYRYDTGDGDTPHLYQTLAMPAPPVSPKPPSSTRTVPQAEPPTGYRTPACASTSGTSTSAVPTTNCCTRSGHSPTTCRSVSGRFLASDAAEHLDCRLLEHLTSGAVVQHAGCARRIAPRSRESSMLNRWNSATRYPLRVTITRAFASGEPNTLPAATSRCTPGRGSAGPSGTALHSGEGGLDRVRGAQEARHHRRNRGRPRRGGSGAPVVGLTLIARTWERAVTVNAQGEIVQLAEGDPLSNAAWTRVSLGRAK